MMWLIQLYIFFAGLIVGTVAHEAGHAAMAWALDMPLLLVRIGSGKALFRKRLGRQCWLSVHVVPLGGAVQVKIGRARRLSRALLYLGGTVGNAVLFGLIAGLSFCNVIETSNAVLLAIAQLYLVVRNLVPFRTRSGGRSDGMHLLLLLKERGQPDVVALRKRLKDSRDQLLLLKEEGQASAVALRKTLKSSCFDPTERALAIEQLVSDDLTAGLTGATAAELDQWSVEALQLSDLPGLRVTRGGILVALNRPAEAREVLLPFLDAPMDAWNAVGARAFLALAARRLRDPDEAALWTAAREAVPLPGPDGKPHALQAVLARFMSDRPLRGLPLETAPGAVPDAAAG